MPNLFSWMQLGFQYLTPLAFASIVGFVCYLLVRRLASRWPGPVLNLGMFFSMACGCMAFSYFPWSLACFGIVVAVCSLGTFAERAVHPVPQSWFVVMFRMLLATIWSLLFCAVLLLVLFLIVGEQPFTVEMMPYSLGALLSPSIVPLFLWLWKSSQLRPGVDKPLEYGKHPQIRGIRGRCEE